MYVSNLSRRVIYAPRQHKLNGPVLTVNILNDAGEKHHHLTSSTCFLSSAFPKLEFFWAIPSILFWCQTHNQILKGCLGICLHLLPTAVISKSCKNIYVRNNPFVPVCPSPAYPFSQAHPPFLLHPSLQTGPLPGMCVQPLPGSG